MEKIKKFLFSPLIALSFMALYFYFILPAINLRSASFWVMILLGIGAFLISYNMFSGKNPIAFLKRLDVYLSAKMQGKQKSENDHYHDKTGDVKKSKIIKVSVIAVVVLLFLVCFVTSSVVFRASAYQKMLNVTESDFSADIAELPISQIPIVDRDTAERLGSRKIGEVVELVSQFNVSSYYSQINYQNKPYRVSPLEYAGFLKWIANKDGGIPYYVSIDMATQKTDLVKLEQGMRYAPSEYFSRDLQRHIRFAYPTKLLENLSFEVDESGHPYWVMSYYDYTIGILGGKDIEGIILVDAVSGEMTDYPGVEIPQWVDMAYSAELILEQANNWGSLKNGFLNSIFVQKNVVVTTEGYNYIAVDDDVWLYTGITSVSADESNIGFILINMRTKEAKTYMINGAEEFSAMESAEGKIQEKGYTATFPILINVADRPSYFISLKDGAGLVKSYAFVSVADYQIVGVADTIDGAKTEYLRMLGIEDSTPDEDAPSADELKEQTGEIVDIATAVVDGNSVYYIMIGDTVYTTDISVSNILPFLKQGDVIKYKATEDLVIVSISK